MANFACTFSLILLFVLLSLTSTSFSKEKTARKSLKVHIQQRSKHDRKKSIRLKGALLRKIKSENQPHSLRNRSKSLKRKIHKRKNTVKNLNRSLKPPQFQKSKTYLRYNVSKLREKSKKQKYKQVLKSGTRHKMKENKKLKLKYKRSKLRSLKNIASVKKPKVVEKSIPSNKVENLKSSNANERYIKDSYIKKLMNASLPQNARIALVRKAIGLPVETDFDKFIAKNEDMLDHKYWKRVHEFNYYEKNIAVRQERENIKKHGGNSDDISSQDLCRYFFDEKCYQRGETVCTEKDDAGDCKKWYHQPFRYDESGKRELLMLKYWEKKPITSGEHEREREHKKEKKKWERRINTCTIQYYSFGGRKSRRLCVPVYKVLRQYPEFAKKIESLYPDANSQNYISDAESIIESIIINSGHPDCQLIEKLFPFMKGHFSMFTEVC